MDVAEIAWEYNLATKAGTTFPPFTLQYGRRPVAKRGSPPKVCDYNPLPGRQITCPSIPLPHHHHQYNVLVGLRRRGLHAKALLLDHLHFGLPAPVDLQRSRDFQVWPPLEKSLSISFRDGHADTVAVAVMAEAVVVATDGSDLGRPQSHARIHVVGRRQEFSPPFVNATRPNSPTLQLPPSKHATCCAAAQAVCDTPPCAHFCPWSRSGAVRYTRRPPPQACFEGGIG